MAVNVELVLSISMNGGDANLDRLLDELVKRAGIPVKARTQRVVVLGPYSQGLCDDFDPFVTIAGYLDGCVQSKSLTLL